MVLAETAAQAKDGAELVEVDYEELDANVEPAKAMGAPLLHEEAPDNLCYDWVLGDESEVDAAFANAHHVTKLDLVNNRLIPNAMEPRAGDRRVRQRHRQLHALVDQARIRTCCA